MLKSLVKNNLAIAPCIICGVLMLILAIGFAIIAFFAVQMIVQNILPICIGIAAVIVLPILAKAYYAKQTGRDYPSEKGGEKKQ